MSKYYEKSLADNEPNDDIKKGLLEQMVESWISNTDGVDGWDAELDYLKGIVKYWEIDSLLLVSKYWTNQRCLVYCITER